MIPSFLFMISFLMLAAIVWSFDFSNKLLGPHDRIVNELDDVLAGKGKKPIVLRRGDDMFMDLVKRINILVEKLPP